MTRPFPIPPPVLFFSCLISGVLLHFVWPVELLPPAPWIRLAAAMPLFGCAFALGAWAFRTMRRAGASPEPTAAPTALVTVGPFRYTRNPLYWALVVALAGFAVLLNSAWVLAAVLVLFVLLDRLVVPREEAALAELFEPEYAAYRRRVRRWL